MKIALVTDTHAGARNDNKIINEYYLKFFEEQFIPYLLNNNITKIVHLGDVFDKRKYINIHTLHTWKQKVFDVLEKNNISMDIILGNHDLYYKDTSKVNSVCEVLQSYNNIKIFQSATEKEIYGLKFLYVPWINIDNQKDSFELIKNTTAEILLGHIEIKGFQMHRGSINIDRGFEVSELQKFDYVLSGHFHHKSREGHIQYLGNPYEMTWNDWNSEKGFHILNTQTRELEFIENERKIFHKIVYNDENKTLEEVMNVDFNKYKDMFVKVIVQEKTNPFFYDTFIDKLEEHAPHDLKKVEKIHDVDAEDVDESISTKDTLTILREHIEDLNIEIDKKKLCDIINELYIEASNMDVG
jgi:DNA repair exonuclease SbcCD nuclease subunit